MNLLSVYPKSYKAHVSTNPIDPNFSAYPKIFGIFGQALL